MGACWVATITVLRLDGREAKRAHCNPAVPPRHFITKRDTALSWGYCVFHHQSSSVERDSLDLELITFQFSISPSAISKARATTFAQSSGDHSPPAHLYVAKMASNHQTVYFAYGSNLQLGQMSDRCPESRYLGHAILHNFRWQINTRGFANVVSSPHDFVEGLCYLLSKKDEKRLDINEGVRSGAYSKECIPVEISRTSPIIVGRRCSEVLAHIHTPAYKSDDGSQSEKVVALVYINRELTNDGLPRDEYVARINDGIQDAMMLGLSSSFVSRYIRHYIDEPGFGSAPSKHQSPRASVATGLCEECKRIEIRGENEDNEIIVTYDDERESKGRE